jgi:hypothetical protein
MINSPHDLSLNEHASHCCAGCPTDGSRRPDLRGLTFLRLNATYRVESILRTSVIRTLTSPLLYYAESSGEVPCIGTANRSIGIEDNMCRGIGTTVRGSINLYCYSSLAGSSN